MLRLAWLTNAQHVFQPALTGRLESILREIVSCDREQRLLRQAHFAKNCLLRIGVQGVTAISQKISSSWAPKNGVQRATAIYTTAIYQEDNVLTKAYMRNCAFLFELKKILHF